MKRFVALFGAILVSASAAAIAADLPDRYAVAPAGPYCAAYSQPFSRADATPARLEETVKEHFSLSVQVADEQSTIYSARPRLVWANETKIYCGMAIGYFAAGELNDEAVFKCDCFYAQMRSYMVR